MKSEKWEVRSEKLEVGSDYLLLMIVTQFDIRYLTDLTVLIMTEVQYNDIYKLEALHIVQLLDSLPAKGSCNKL